MTDNCSFTGKVQKFPGAGGWVYVAVPKKFTNELKKRRLVWGKFPIVVKVGKTTWETKLMMKKGGDFFIAFKETVRKSEKAIKIGEVISVSFQVE